ncbi:hypothetical protein TraAM80_04697 [Trypanosoma rangeli]|uniref:Doublecortin domain-containing protein n=1 Tax=Trypanosoma rangeli TaxID=5698 RepID=A0A422NIB8_TRYRA|nr:uncharacterized protein TraAM80_04697 [Trypanosoma rangeli]RNF05223.1 hypothetical protein TraAM80_04697 [Trypanosoma rangeli]|eukprot:RNF05223.1 hypothetical protein TraAM80_04697 [Trypanosoma rangeli]
MRDAFDEMFCVSKEAESCAEQQRDRLCKECRRMNRDVMGRQKECRPEDTITDVRLSLHSPDIPSAASKNAVGAHEQAVYETKRSHSAGSGSIKEECRRRSLWKPVKRRPYVCKGQRGDASYFSLDSNGDVDSGPLKLNCGRSKATTSETFSSYPQMLPLPLSGHPCYRGKCRDYGDVSCLSCRCLSGRLESRSYRVPGVGPTPPRPNLRFAPGCATTPTNFEDTSMCVPKGPLVHEKSFWINVWPCFGTFTSFLCKPTRILVHSSYRYMEQLTEKAGMLMNCQPAPSVLFEPDGRSLRSLAQLLPEQHYLFFPSGGLYRKEAVPAALLVELVRTAKLTLQQHSRSHDN